MAGTEAGRLERGAVTALPAVLGAGVFAIAFVHVHDVARWAGQPDWAAWLIACTGEAMAVAALAAILACRRVGQSVVPAVVVLVAAVGFSMACNLAAATVKIHGDVDGPAADPGAWVPVMAVWPVVAFVLVATLKATRPGGRGPGSNPALGVGWPPAAVPTPVPAGESAPGRLAVASSWGAAEIGAGPADRTGRPGVGDDTAAVASGPTSQSGRPDPAGPATVPAVPVLPVPVPAAEADAEPPAGRSGGTGNGRGKPAARSRSAAAGGGSRPRHGEVALVEAARAAGVALAAAGISITRDALARRLKVATVVVTPAVLAAACAAAAEQPPAPAPEPGGSAPGPPAGRPAATWVEAELELVSLPARNGRRPV